MPNLLDDLKREIKIALRRYELSFNHEKSMPKDRATTVFRLKCFTNRAQTRQAIYQYLLLFRTTMRTGFDLFCLHIPTGRSTLFTIIMQILDKTKYSELAFSHEENKFLKQQNCTLKERISGDIGCNSEATASKQKKTKVLSAAIIKLETRIEDLEQKNNALVVLCQQFAEGKNNCEMALFSK